MRISKRLFQEEWNTAGDEVTLYKGNRLVRMSIKGDTVAVTTGVQGGSLRTTTKRFPASSVGRSNEKSGADNAKKFVNDEITRLKSREGYTDEKGQEAATVLLTPMLAIPMDAKVRNTITPMVFLQPKLDGVRALINTSTGQIISRAHKPLYAQHISDAVKSLGITKVEWLDGELYSHSMGFQTIVGLVKRHDKSEADAKAKLKFQFHMYDCIMSSPFKTRLQFLEQVRNQNKEIIGTSEETSKRPIRLVDTWYIPQSEIQEHHLKNVENGYEGSMLRLDDNTPYQVNKRSKSLIKVKDFVDAEYKIVGFVAEKGDINKQETLGAVELETEDGKRFRARPAMTAADRQEIWDNQSKYLGKLAVIKYQELSDTGIPRFPVFKGLHFETSH